MDKTVSAGVHLIGDCVLVFSKRTEIWKWKQTAEERRGNVLAFITAVTGSSMCGCVCRQKVFVTLPRTGTVDAVSIY